MSYSLRGVYQDKNLTIPDQFDSTFTNPPIHFLQYVYPVKDSISILMKAECLLRMELTLMT